MFYKLLLGLMLEAVFFFFFSFFYTVFLYAFCKVVVFLYKKKLSGNSPLARIRFILKGKFT